MKVARSVLLPILFLVDTPLIIAIVLFVFFGFSGYYGQDSHAYLRFATEWKASGFDPSLLADFHWSFGFPFAGIAFSYLGVPLKWALVLVSFLSALGTLLLLRRMIREMYGRDGTLWILLGAATQVYFIRGGMLALSDMLCTFLVLATIYFLWKYRQRKEWSYMLYACALAAAAFSVRYAAAPLLLFPLAVGFAQVFRENQVVIRLSAGVLLIALCSMFVFAGPHFFAVLKELLAQWNLTNFVALSGETEVWQERTVPNLLYGFGNFMHLGYLSAGVFLLPYYRSIAWKNPVLLGVAFYLICIMGMEAQNYRFLMLVHPLVLFFLFPAFEGLKREVQKRRVWALFVGGILLINCAFFVYSFRKTYAVFEAEKVLAAEINALDQESVIYSFYVDQAFPTYGVKNEIRNLYVEEYLNFESGALVVFNPEEFEQQWKGTLVWKNWLRLQRENELDLVMEVYGTWKIYRIR